MSDSSKSLVGKNRLVKWYIKIVDSFLSWLPEPKRVPIVPGLVKRVLLANVAHHSDVINATSAINVVRKAYPNAKIGFLTSKTCQKIVQDHPDVVYTHTLNHVQSNLNHCNLIKKVWDHFWTARRARKKIKALKYDLAIDLYFYCPNSAYFLYRCKIPTRVGFTSGGCGQLFTHRKPFVPKHQHVMDYYKELFSLIFIDQSLYKDIRLDLPRYDIDVKKKFSLDRYAIFHPGCHAKYKEWDIEKWRDLLKETTEVQVVFTGISKHERKLVKKISPFAYNLCNELDWSDLIELVYHAEYVVCVDTAIQHIADAFDTPCIVLNTGNVLPKIIDHKSEKVRSLSVKTLCFNCNKKQGCQSMACIKRVPVKKVKDQLRQLV